jgi:PST family polysaccharide transporter
MASGLMTMGGAYAVRILILRTLGLEATGLYQSAWTIGGLYVGFILQAMGADFYPRLTAVANDDAECNRLVNEQARVGLLLACPGLLATLTFAPTIMTLFYTVKFRAAIGLLRWICLGAMLQVVTWPMSSIIAAKGKTIIFFVSDFLWTIVYLALARTCIAAFGLDGAGLAFFLSYICHGIVTYYVVRHLSEFRWSVENISQGLLFFGLTALAFCSAFIMPVIAALGLGAFLVLFTIIYSFRTLSQFLPQHRIPRHLNQWLARFGLIAPGPFSTGTQLMRDIK